MWTEGKEVIGRERERGRRRVRAKEIQAHTFRVRERSERGGVERVEPLTCCSRGKDEAKAIRSTHAGVENDDAAQSAASASTFAP